MSVGHERPSRERGGELDSSDSTREVFPASTTVLLSTPSPHQTRIVRS